MDLNGLNNKIRLSENLGMKEEHRKLIRCNFATLVDECDCDTVLPLLIEKNVFSAEKASKYRNNTTGDLERKRENARNLFLDIQRRGPEAFSNLVQSLHETGQSTLANCLDPATSYDSSKSSYKTGYPRKQAIPYQLPINHDCQTHDVQQILDLAKSPGAPFLLNMNTQPLEVKVRHSTQFFDDPTKSVVQVYRTRSLHRARVLIINNSKFSSEPERKGSEVDQENLVELFKQMGMHVELYENLNYLEMKGRIQMFTSNEDLKKIDICIAVFMSHGSDDNYVKCTDGVELKTFWIEEQFDNTNCPHLHCKPKIFIYQVCRGNLKYTGYERRIETDSVAGTTMLRKIEDMLIAHSTIEGQVSHRDTLLGTWYIQLICKVFMEHAHNTHVENLLKKVDEELALVKSEGFTMQTSVYTNQGFRKCYLHPGIYEKNEEIMKLPVCE